MSAWRRRKRRSKISKPGRSDEPLPPDDTKHGTDRKDKMKMSPLLKKALAALGLIGLVLAAYFLLARPYQLHWGATAEEISRAMPGDELNPNPKFLATRAITINGTPETIWPWLIQMGYGRAGYYGYDILENLGSPAACRARRASCRNSRTSSPATRCRSARLPKCLSMPSSRTST